MNHKHIYNRKNKYFEQLDEEGLRQFQTQLDFEHSAKPVMKYKILPTKHELQPYDS
jgi:hypothetical protein